MMEQNIPTQNNDELIEISENQDEILEIRDKY